MPEYPKRHKFFAHRYTRLILRMCAAQEIGVEAVLLCIHVAHTEDVRHYKAPPMFWNHELCSVLAMSWGRLDRARRKAVQAGWLHYGQGRKGQVSLYWVTVPPGFRRMDDKPMGDSEVDMSTGELDLQNGAQFGDQSGDQSVDTTDLNLQNGAQFGDQSGDPNGIHPGSKRGTFIPNPYPNPRSVQKEAGSSNSVLDVRAVVLSPPLDTDQFRAALELWIKHRREIRHPLNPTCFEQQLRKFATWGVDRSIAAIEHTVAMGWQGLREPELSDGGRAKQIRKPTRI